MRGQPIPAVIRGGLIARWEELRDDGRFGDVTEDQVRTAILDYEKGAPPSSELERMLYAICDEMGRTWDTTWAALGLPPEPPTITRTVKQSAAPSAMAAPVPSEREVSEGLVSRLWKGKVPLPVTFWAFGFVPNVVIGILLTMLSLNDPSTARTFSFVYLGYYAFIVVAIWRSSERYEGPKIWGSLARIVVMLGVLRTVLAVLVAQ